MTAKQILDGMMLSYFRHLVDSDHTASEAIDAMVGKLLVPSPEPTLAEVRWLNAIKYRLKAELTVDDASDDGKDETPLLDKIENATAAEPEKTAKKTK